MSDPHRFDDLFAAFGPIRLRRFFGGEGIVADEMMIGMVSKDIIYFHTDEETRGAFVAEGCKPFSFLKRSTGETIVTRWYALPERLYDDPEELAVWARAALNAMRHSPTQMKKRKKVAAKVGRAVKKAVAKKSVKKKKKR